MRLNAIINVDKTLILALPRKQNRRPIGYITLLSIISPLKRRVLRLQSLIYALLTMVMLAEPLTGVKGPIGYITLLSIISPLKRGVRRL